MNCNICNGETGTLTVRERMMGFNERFTYYKCRECGHAHLAEIPNLDKYYDPNKYYSFKKPKVPIFNSLSYKAFLNMYVHRGKSGSILDYGCGSGSFIVELKSHGYQKIRRV